MISRMSSLSAEQHLPQYRTQKATLFRLVSCEEAVKNGEHYLNRQARITLTV